MTKSSDNLEPSKKLLFFSFLTTGFSPKRDYVFALAYGHSSPSILFLDSISEKMEFLQKINEIFAHKTLIHYAGDAYFFPMLKENFSIYATVQSVDLMKSFQSLKNLLPIQKISKKELMNFLFFTSTEAQSGECTTLYSEYLKGKIENKEKIIASLIEQWTFVRSLYNKYLDLSETLSIPVRIQKKDLTFTIQSVKSHYEFITVSGFFHQHLENTYYQFPPFSLEIKDNFASFHIRTQETEFKGESCIFHDGQYLSGVEHVRTRWSTVPNLFLLQKNGIWQKEELKDLIQALFLGLEQEV